MRNAADDVDDCVLKTRCGNLGNGSFHLADLVFENNAHGCSLNDGVDNILLFATDFFEQVAVAAGSIL